MESVPSSGNGTSLKELREERKDGNKFLLWLKKHCPFFLNLHSLFYFGVLVFLTGVAWMIGSLVSNSGTQLYGWDYSSQYVTFTYDLWDVWHAFFKTGHFELYSTSTYLGSDNIGSNAYYGLFDPFLFVCYIFPRSWIPQTFAFATLLKGIASALAMRAYTRYLGVSETASRIGGLVYAFSGYVCFFVGFPSFISMTFAVPLILLGIEKVLKEQKPVTLCVGLALMGLISFFFLVVVCIFGVLYAVWRYFATIQTRTAKMNFATIGLGVASFAVGILLSAWVLLPSLRESSLSGRTSSIGVAYLNSLRRVFFGVNFRSVFTDVNGYAAIVRKLFEMVGGNPARELQGLISFFYPTCNYLWLPLAQSTGSYKYDSWTSSLFCYTPIVILFFISIYSSIQRKKWSHLVVFAICTYLVFTNFAYFFFYAFTGDGYGRWYIVLMPLIIYYGVSELDRLKTEKPWVILSGCLTALGLAAFTWIFVSNYLPGKTFTFEDGTYTYWKSEYTTPAVTTISGVSHNLGWLVYYQLILYAVVGASYIILRKKEWLLHYIIFGSIIVEITVAGNLSFVYGSSFSYKNSYNGGAATVEKLTGVWDYINANDTSYFRGHTDGLADRNTPQALGYNGTSTFHSLFNYDLVQLTRYSHMTNNEGTNTIYGMNYNTKSWSGYYGNKRLAFDTALGMKYYVVKDEGYDAYGDVSYADNIPFGSELVTGDYSDDYRVYRNTTIDDIALGHAVDTYYKANTRYNSTYDDFFTSTTNYTELIRNEEIYLEGAIISDSDVERFEQEDLWEEGEEKWDSAPSTYSNVRQISYSKALYRNDYKWWGPSIDGELQGPTYFLSDSETEILSSIPTLISSDYDKIVLTPSSGDYFNTDNDGAYFLINYSLDLYSKVTRIYMIGDTFNEDGSIKETNVMLSYEYHVLKDYYNRKVNNYGSLFGFYPKGRVKYICFCGKDSDGSTRTFSSPSIYMCERSEIDGENGILTKLKSSEYNLTNVEYSPDKFTFNTSFSENRLVTTMLGYDAGWKVTATDEAGNHYTPNTYKVDGGFLGFVAPGGVGEVTYTLSYQTPYLNEGFILTLVGIFLLGGYEAARWFYFRKKRQKPEVEAAGQEMGGEPQKEEVEKQDEEIPTS